MKNAIRLTLFAVLLTGASTAFGQKFGYINSQELIAAMPERDSVESKMNKISQDFQQQLELIQVEFNNKYNDYQKEYNNLAESIRQIREQELTGLQNRFEEVQRMAQQEIQKNQMELMAPVVEKADNAIRKVSQANGYFIVFDQAAGPMVYFDEAQIDNILPLVKAELGIPATAAPGN